MTAGSGESGRAAGMSLAGYPAKAVAVVGMAARLPGADHVEAYWRNIREGVESVVRHRIDDLITRGVDPALIENANFVPASACLSGADCFDAAFFGISAREAAIMDPQHRVFLECAYHALEDASYNPDRFPGLIGVYAGSTLNTYMLYNVMSNRESAFSAVGDLQVMLGNDKEYLATRASFKLNLVGPSIAVQSACSTSLVAVHMACQALMAGDCDMALAGGASVRMPLHAGYLANPGGTSSPDGHCRAFDADASGSVVGSGVGIVVLKRLADAARDGDTISAVIVGSAINNDGGAKASFTAPSMEGQSRAIRLAIERAGLSARQISYVEAHGTGTPIGDPIEVAALSRAFRAFTEDTGYCWIGSVKPNIGHLDAAAGIAGFIKAVLALKHRAIPPNINFRRPNPMLEIEKSPFRVPTELVRLPATEMVYASVNSLAMGGTNANVVLAAPPRPTGSARSERTRHYIAISGRDSRVLEDLSQSIAGSLARFSDDDLPDIAYSLAVGRRGHDERRIVVASRLEDAEAVLSIRGSPRRRDGTALRNARLGVLLPGQGVHVQGVAADADPLLRAKIELACDWFEPEVGGQVRQLLFGANERSAGGRIGTELAQPAIFAMQWALASTIMDFGLEPSVFLGHSLGEFVAACLAGVFAPADAAAAVRARGMLMSEAEPGAMAHVMASADRIRPLVEQFGCELAAVNAPAAVTVSGRPDDVEAFEAAVVGAGHRVGRLPVGHGFHSRLMDAASSAFTEVMAAISLSPPRTPVISNVTGCLLTAKEATSPSYWGQQLRRCVNFAAGVNHATQAMGVSIFLDLGPGTSLSSLVSMSGAQPIALIPAIGEDRPTGNDLMDAACQLWLSGLDVDLSAPYRGEARRRVSLPGYPFARERHWLEAVPRQPAGRAAATEELASVRPVGPPRPDAPTVVKAAAGSVEEVEQYLLTLWSGLLGAEVTGLDSNFFDLGGDSLVAMQMVASIRDNLHPDMPVGMIFEAPTVKALAVQIHAELGGDGLASREQAPDEGEPTPSRMSAGTAGAADHLDEMVARMSDDEVRAALARLDGEEK